MISPKYGTIKMISSYYQNNVRRKRSETAFKNGNRGIFFMKKVTLLLATVLVLVFGIGMTAKAASCKEVKSKFSREQYRVMEEEYVNEVRLLLLEKGCKNAGITLTYITDSEGNRDYIVTVHHAKLEKMEAQELLLLEARMQESAESILVADVTLKQL